MYYLTNDFLIWYYEKHGLSEFKEYCLENHVVPTILKERPSGGGYSILQDYEFNQLKDLL